MPCLGMQQLRELRRPGFLTRFQSLSDALRLLLAPVGGQAGTAAIPGRRQIGAALLGLPAGHLPLAQELVVPQDVFLSAALIMS